MKVYALDLLGGGLIWSYSTGDQVISQPAVSAGRVFVGSVGWQTLCTKRSKPAWSCGVLQPADKVDSSPTVANGLLYVGSHDGKIYSLNATTGMVGYDWELHNTVVWSYDTGDMIMFSAPAISGGNLYVGGYNGKIYCLNAQTGSYLWSYQTGYAVVSSPTVVDGVVYVGSEDNSIYALDASNGELVWKYTTGDQITLSSPA